MVGTHGWEFVYEKEDGSQVFQCGCGAEKVVVGKHPDGREIRAGYRKGRKECPYTTGRRTLATIDRYVSVQEIYDQLTQAEGWPYGPYSEHPVEYYRKRDRALVCILYMACLRISEALNLRKSQFHKLDDRIEITGIKLSKLRKAGVPRKHEFREAWLPLEGERAKLTALVVEYLDDLENGAQLFGFERHRAWQIVKAWTGRFCHYFRSCGEEYLYGKWKADLLAVADYVKVTPDTLSEYIRGRYKRHDAV